MIRIILVGLFMFITPAFAFELGVKETNYWDKAVEYEIQRIEFARMAPNKAALNAWLENKESEYNDIRRARNSNMLRSVMQVYELKWPEDRKEIIKYASNLLQDVYDDAIKLMKQRRNRKK